ncbi:DUF6332 family protein [Streptomyces sp. NPDC093085]|uniref:DUF6332 family protein n=1 Tax=Streptomyces sp. NPDC093085 TaxID=3155068 RepID=UPI00341F6ECB
MGTRSGAERDAITVEIVFAAVTGVVAAALVFGAIAGAGWYLGLPPVVTRIAGVVAGLVFVARVVQVLRRFTPGAPGGAAAQPSHPGRTRPDS